MKMDLKLALRYRPLAGPFSPREAPLLEKLTAALTASGARILTSEETRGETRGPTIYRLRTECETTQETRQRLHKIR
jgi:hypothetical protein